MTNLNLIRSVAWSYHNTTGIDLEELFSEASLAYCEAIQRYDMTKSKFTTFAYCHMKNHLKNYIKKQKTNFLSYMEIEQLPEIGFTPTRNEWSELLNSMSLECREITLEIVDNIERYNITPRVARGQLKKALREKGWSWPKIYQSFREIKSILS